LPRDDRYLLLLQAELKGFFRHRRSAHLIPLWVMGVLITGWIYPIGSPFAPVVIVVAAGLELEFNNIFFRSPNEVKAMHLFPLPVRGIVVTKNLTTLLLFTGLCALTSMALLYFSPEVVGVRQLAGAACYLSSVLFPLLVIGNDHSIRNPRPACGLQLNDMLEAIWMLVYLGLISLPYFVLRAVLDHPAPSLVYGLATAMYWYRVSIPRTVAHYERERMNLCLL
jgi:hypothetical protein